MAAVNLNPLGKYNRHRPEERLLYKTIQTYWPIFLREQERVGKNIPIFIKDEFNKFLECGIPEFGFVRTYCYQCRESGIVPFSCKKRGFCPSCCGRRMNDEGAHLIDKVIPEVVMRQWVLSFPYKLRYQVAFDPKITNKVLSIYIRAIKSFQKKRARNFGIKDGQLGSVTFIQRFGSALNLNVHFHALITDGVYFKSAEGEYRFQRLEAPSKEDLLHLAKKIEKKVTVLMTKFETDNLCQSEFDEEILNGISKLSIQHKAGFGERAGLSLRRYGKENISVDVDSEDPYSVNVGGFSLNARVWVFGNDREKLEKLIRYMARGPISTERLSESFPNQLIYKMKTKWRDGTTHVSFSHLDFIARLVALIPPPRMNLVRYHGVFAPCFKDRKFIVPKKIVEKCETFVEPKIMLQLSEKFRRSRLLWSEMLKRTFKIDVTVCLRCNGRIEQIAVIKDKVVALTILKSMNQVTIFKPASLVWSRGPPEQSANSENEYDQRGSW